MTEKAVFGSMSAIGYSKFPYGRCKATRVLAEALAQLLACLYGVGAHPATLGAKSNLTVDPVLN